MMLTREQVAERLKLSKAMVSRLAEQGELPGVNIGKGTKRKIWRFDAKIIREWRAGGAHVNSTNAAAATTPAAANGNGAGHADEFLTSAEAAALLGLTPTGVGRRIRSGMLKAETTSGRGGRGGVYRISRAAVEASLRKHPPGPRAKGTPALVLDAPAPAAQAARPAPNGRPTEVAPAPAGEGAQRVAGGLLAAAFGDRLSRMEARIEEIYALLKPLAG